MAESSTKRRRISLNVEKKGEILKYIEKHKEQSQGQIGLQFGLS